MSEGYQRRPEERSEWPWVPTLAVLAITVIAIVMTWANCFARLENKTLRTENARLLQYNKELSTQLDYHTCRVQYEPSPMPEPTNQSPTLIEDEPRPLTEDEFTELQKRLKGEQVGEGPTLLPGEEK